MENFAGELVVLGSLNKCVGKFQVHTLNRFEANKFRISFFADIQNLI